MNGHDTFQDLRPRLFAIAYRMLGSASDAEDVVQDAFLRYQRALSEGVQIHSPSAYLATVVTRLSIDEQRSARTRREEYVGTWLPEPVLTDEMADDPAARAEMAESLSMAFLLLLERLGPVERAVFLLHDVFGYGYDEIALMVDRSEANCRQIAARARHRIRSERPRFSASSEQREQLAARFFAAVTDGDMEALTSMLAADVVVYGDGGGKAPQWAAPIVGSDRVARLLAGIGRQMREANARIEQRTVNGQPGAMVLAADGSLISVFALDIRDGVVHSFQSVVNPDKLRRLGPVADVRALMRQRIEKRGAVRDG